MPKVDSLLVKILIATPMIAVPVLPLRIKRVVLILLWMQLDFLIRVFHIAAISNHVNVYV